MVYVILESPTLNIERVRLRVTKGGHSVPKAKIVARYHKSLAQMPWFLNQADQAWLFDNSGQTPLLIGEKRDGHVYVTLDAPPVVIEALRNLP